MRVCIEAMQVYTVAMQADIVTMSVQHRGNAGLHHGDVGLIRGNAGLHQGDVGLLCGDGDAKNGVPECL